jgi:uncharacterized pyridoxamine 5'-phosphate oxidase family protein
MNIPEAINDSISQELLNSEALAHVSYIGLDGDPRVVPMGFLWNGKEVIVCTADSAPKVKALTQNPRVALTIDTDARSAKQLLIRGLADIEIVDGVPEEYIKMSAKALSPDQLTEFESQVRAVYKHMARIKIEPTWAKVYDFTAGKVPEFLRKLI